MKRLWMALALFVSLWGLMPATVNAERATWKDKAVNFSTIQTITVPDDATWQPGTHPSDIDRLKLRNRIDKMTVKGLSNYAVTVAPVAPLEDEKVAKLDGTLSEVEKPAISADAHVHITITDWQYRQYWVAPQLYTTYRTIRHYDRWGHAYYWTVPVERVEPGYYMTVASMTAHFTVTDALGHTIYKTIDSRSADKDPVDMFGRALSQFYSEFNKLGRTNK